MQAQNDQVHRQNPSKLQGSGGGSGDGGGNGDSGGGSDGRGGRGPAPPDSPDQFALIAPFAKTDCVGTAADLRQ